MRYSAQQTGAAPMFTVVEKIFNLCGRQIDSDAIAEYETEQEANHKVEHLYASYGETDGDGNRYQWYVIAD
jgi:hypothetical protein